MTLNTTYGFVYKESGLGILKKNGIGYWGATTLQRWLHIAPSFFILPIFLVVFLVRICIVFIKALTKAKVMTFVLYKKK